METLSLRDAAKEFGIDHTTISGWIDAGLITPAKRPERRGQPMLVNRADVERVARVRQPGRGHWTRNRLAS